MFHHISVVLMIACAVANVYTGDYKLAAYQVFIALMLVWGRDDARDAALMRALIMARLKFIPMPDGKFWVESQSGDGCGHANPRDAITQALQDVER